VHIKPRKLLRGTPSPATSANPAFGFGSFTAADLGSFSWAAAASDQPPAFLIPIYKAAGRRYHVPWEILAAINAIETDYGRNLNVSSAGAIGWMQFMPDTWRMYGVTVEGKGTPNPYDPHDAIFAAARLLAANGARTDLRAALFAYNHANWYVDSVLWWAAEIKAHAHGRHAAKVGYALPLERHYMHALGRTDDGVDIEDAPDGAAVFSITPGVVTAVASDPGGFGPNYPVVLVTAGPLAGRSIYYGHVAASLVTVGEHVDAGQPIAVMGHTGDAIGLGHGHIEIGFSNGSGNPLDHHGSEAWTPAGEAMRRVLVALSAEFGVHNS
jgi:murein DD-endopeptidase MepM/ murein hydrolase activator NlpD